MTRRFSRLSHINHDHDKINSNCLIFCFTPFEQSTLMQGSVSANQLFRLGKCSPNQ
ncbi:unnamed protein product [Brassica oleracea var. botrytis]